MKTLVLITLFIVLGAHASQAVQNDWSGGAGAAGPVSDWNGQFSSSENTAWCSIPGQLQLSSTPISPCVEHQVAGGIDSPYAAVVADLNGDGFNDIVCGSGTDDGVLAYYGSSAGTWTFQLVSDSTPSAIGLSVADFDGDGLLDIASCADTEVHLFYNSGGTVPAWTLDVPGSGYQTLHDVDAVDMDLDGDQDIVVADYDADRLFWLRNDGSSWTDLTINDEIDYPCKPHAADIDGDGNMDVACSAWLGEKIMVYYGSGGGEPLWTPQTVDPACVAAHGTRACDIDGDGDVDILGASINASCLYLYRNVGGTVPSWEREDMGIISGTAMVRIGDIDGDGDQDATASSWGNAGVAWWENDGAGVFQQHLIKSGGQATSWSIAGDLDNDGDLDVLAVRFQQGSLYWYEVTEFLPSGWMESSILDTDSSPCWSSFSWISETPEGCGVSFQFKSSDNSSAMGEWSQEYFSPSDLSGLVSRYFQYRLNLSSSDPLHSPVISSVELNWDPMGTGESEDMGMLFCDSPCYGSVLLRVSECFAETVMVDVYSAAGRLVDSRSAWGGDTVELDGLSSGMYLFRAESAGGSSQTGRTVLIAR